MNISLFFGIISILLIPIMLYCNCKPHLPQDLEGGGFMNVTIELDGSLILLLADIITIVVFFIQVLRFICKELLVLYRKIIHKIAEDVAADINSGAKKDDDNISIEKADQNNHLKGG